MYLLIKIECCVQIDDDDVIDWKINIEFKCVCVRLSAFVCVCMRVKTHKKKKFVSFVNIVNIFSCDAMPDDRIKKMKD